MPIVSKTKLGYRQNILMLYSQGYSTINCTICKCPHSKRKLACVAVCSLNQWPLDFDGNFTRTLMSIRKAKQVGAQIRVGPELELCGYDCEDHFLEHETVKHCWDSVWKLVNTDSISDILCLVGCPVLYCNALYNCTLFILNRRILLIRPKTYVVNKGHSRESRYFSAWPIDDTELHDFPLPWEATETRCPITGKTNEKHDRTFIGLGIVKCCDIMIGMGSFEDMQQQEFLSLAKHSVHIICNGDCTINETKNMNNRVQNILKTTEKYGITYLRSTQKGCCGSRVFYDGFAIVASKGEIAANTSPFELTSVSVAAGFIDLSPHTCYRNLHDQLQNESKDKNMKFPVINISYLHLNLGIHDVDYRIVEHIGEVQPIWNYSFTELWAHGVACWLWDYLRTSGSRGFFVALSGGADSSAIVALIGLMCELIMEAINKGNIEVINCLEDIFGIDRYQEKFPKSRKDLCQKLLHTCYMESKHSSTVTKEFANKLANEVGSYHLTSNIDSIVNSFVTTCESLLNIKLNFCASGGSKMQDLALQNIQARTRLVLSYLIASLLPESRNSINLDHKINKKNVKSLTLNMFDEYETSKSVKSENIQNFGYDIQKNLKERSNYLLVLGTGNMSEGISGYLSKYDSSAGDINPIGSISKVDLVKFILWASKSENLGYSTLKEIAIMSPSAELTPCTYPPGVIKDDGDDESKIMSITRSKMYDNYHMNEYFAILQSHLNPADEIIDYNSFFTPTFLLGKGILAHSQTDELDMGITYNDLCELEKMMIEKRCGPVDLFLKCCIVNNHISVETIGKKVKKFLLNYANNRHKASALAPSCIINESSAIGLRTDDRPLLYCSLSRQFAIIDCYITRGLEDSMNAK